MLNFYRRFLPHSAATQAQLYDALSGPRVKGSHPVAWTPDLHKAFEECKASLSRATLLAHPDLSAPLALVTDASTSAMGVVLQQRVNNAWQPLAFFSRKLNPAQQKYSAYDREQLAVYEAVKHFRYMLEARHFTIYIDHKPITYTFQQKRDKCSPRQFNHLDFVSQFTTDIRHISGQDNVVADTLSRVDSVTAPPSHDAPASVQNSDDELGTLLASNTALRFEKQQVPGTTSPSTTTRLPGNLGRIFQPHYGSKCSRLSTSCRTPAPRQQRDWWHSVSCGQAFRRTAAPGHGPARSANAPKSPATQLLHWETSRCLQPVSCTCI
jgi:cleavage and polyadenylation specificity factor subunit 1